MYDRLWPPLWIECVPLVSVGALPQPAVAASTPLVAATAVPPPRRVRAGPAVTATRTAATAMAGIRILRLGIEHLSFPRIEGHGSGAVAGTGHVRTVTCLALQGQ